MFVDHVDISCTLNPGVIGLYWSKIELQLMLMQLTLMQEKKQDPSSIQLGS